MEFAIIFPILMVMLVGVAEGFNLHLAGRKVVIAAQTAADLTSQETSVNNARMNQIFTAVGLIMVPFRGALGLDVISVDADRRGRISARRLFLGGNGPAQGVPPEAPGLVTRNDSVIAVTVTYIHQPGLRLVFGEVPITERAFARPRRTRSITFTP